MLNVVIFCLKVLGLKFLAGCLFLWQYCSVPFIYRFWFNSCLSISTWIIHWYYI